MLRAYDRSVDDSGRLAQKSLRKFSQDDRRLLVEKENETLTITRQTDMLEIGRTSVYRRARKEVSHGIYPMRFDLVRKGLSSMRKNLLPLLLWCLLCFTGSAVAENTKYDIKWAYHNGLAQFHKDGKVGLMDEVGNVVLPAEYDEIDYSHDVGKEPVTVKKGEKIGLLDEKGKLLNSAQWDDIVQGDGYFIVINESLYGIVNAKGEIVVEPQYGFLRALGEGRIGYSLTAKESVRYGYIDDELNTFMGLMDTEGNRITPPIFFDIWEFHDGLAVSGLGTEAGYGFFIDPDGNQVMDAHGYEISSNFVNGYATIFEWITTEELQNNLDKTDFVDGHFPVFGIMDRSGTITVKPQFNSNGVINDYGLLDVYDAVTGKCGFVNMKGEVVIPYIAINRPSFQDDACVIQTEDRQWRCYDSQGYVVFTLECEELSDFTEGYALACDKADGKNVYRLIDRQGNVAFEIICEKLFGFSEGYAVVNDTINGEKMSGMIDRQGNYVWGPYAMFISSIHNGMSVIGVRTQAGVSKDLYGYMNQKWGIVIEPEWDMAYSFDETGLAKVVRNGAYGYINVDGEIVSGSRTMQKAE